MDNINLLLRLMDIPGPSGDEELVRKEILKEIKGHVDEIKIDRLGNLIARKKGIAPRIMFAAHMDEVGLMVRKIEKGGKIKCAEIGGISAKSLVNSKIYIKTESCIIKGIVKKKGKKKVSKVSGLTILTKNPLKTLAGGISIGDYVHLDAENKITKGGFIEGKSLDNRIGCYILIELIKILKEIKNDTWFVFTVQEEIGMHGATTSAFEIKPDIAIAVDVTDAVDMPLMKKSLGKGPVLTIKDADFIADKCINNWIKKIASKNKIPLQPNVYDTGTTDAANISLSRNGVPATVLGVPLSDEHTPKGKASIKDIENAILLLKELIKSPPTVCVE